MARWTSTWRSSSISSAAQRLARGCDIFSVVVRSLPLAAISLFPVGPLTPVTGAITIYSPLCCLQVQCRSISSFTLSFHFTPIIPRLYKQRSLPRLGHPPRRNCQQGSYFQSAVLIL